MTEALAFATSVYKAIDTMNEKKLAPFLTDDCTFVFGNSKPVVGRAASADASKAFMAQNRGHQARSRRCLESRRQYYLQDDGHLHPQGRQEDEFSGRHDLARERQGDRRLSHIRRQHPSVRSVVFGNGQMFSLCLVQRMCTRRLGSEARRSWRGAVATKKSELTFS